VLTSPAMGKGKQGAKSAKKDSARRFGAQDRQEAVSKGQFCARLGQLGWNYFQPEKDLGEDFTVQIYDDGVSSGLSFHVQLKSFANAEKRKRKRSPGELRYPLFVKDIEHWEVQSTPVVLVIWDVEKDTGYWETIPRIIEALEKKGKAWREKKSVDVTVSLENETDDEGMGRLRYELAQFTLPLFNAHRSMTVKMTMSKATADELIAAWDRGRGMTLRNESLPKIEWPTWHSRLFGPRGKTSEVQIGPVKPSTVSVALRVEVRVGKAMTAIPHVELRWVGAGIKKIYLLNEHQRHPLVFSVEGEFGANTHQFQFRRLTLFISSTIYKRLKFLTEIEFEDGTKEINIEFASVDLEIAPLLNVRGGIIMNPIGSFNQNHDGPKWEFVDRPISATQMLPATFSNVGFGIYGKKYTKEWVYAYEVYLSNGFDESIIDNPENKTFLPATKNNPNRFEENFNGTMLFTGKVALRNRNIGELGLSYMGGIYNKFQEDGLLLDIKRRAEVYAADFNTTVPLSNTYINAELAFVRVNIPETYTEQFGRKQKGGFVDIVQPVFKKPILGFTNSVMNLALRLEYVDWNNGTFKSTGDNIRDDIKSISGGISWRPTTQSIFRIIYKYSERTDILGNPPSKSGAIQIGVSSYF